AVSRNAFHLSQQIIKNKWGVALPTEKLGDALYGKTLGLFGLGKIGFETAKKAQLLYGMKVIYHNRSPRPALAAQLDAAHVAFDPRLDQRDVLSVRANLSEESSGRFNREAFRKLKPTDLFSNTRRGGLHNEGDLIAALNQKEIGRAGLDVTNP